MLHNAPMYSYIPAQDAARARRFYEEKLGFKPGREAAGGVTCESGNGTGCFLLPVSDPEPPYLAGEPGVLTGRGHRRGCRRAEGAWREVRGVPHAGGGQERHLGRWSRRGCMVQGHGRKHHGAGPECRSSAGVRSDVDRRTKRRQP